QPGWYVLQSDEIEEARSVVTQDAETRHRGNLMTGERAVRGPATHPQCRGDEERDGEHHAQREQRHRVGDMRICELDENRAQREEHHAADRERETGDEPTAVFFGLAQDGHRPAMPAEIRWFTVHLLECADCTVTRRMSSRRAVSLA